LVLGKALSAGFRGVVQAIVIYALALAMHLAIRFEPLTLLGVLLIVVLGSALFSMFSLIVACIVKTRERFMGVGQVLTMPLFFASSAIYPLEQMPAWLRTVARFNPLTYLVDALRDLMVPSATVTLGWGLDSLILFAIFAGLMVIATRLYPSLVR
jgi:ABC-2 type transport system permease protein